MLRTASCYFIEEYVLQWSISPSDNGAICFRSQRQAVGNQSEMGKSQCGALQEVCCLQTVNPS